MRCTQKTHIEPFEKSMKAMDSAIIFQLPPKKMNMAAPEFGSRRSSISGCRAVGCRRNHH